MWIPSMGNHGAAGYQNAGVLVDLVLDYYINERHLFVSMMEIIAGQVVIHCNLAITGIRQVHDLINHIIIGNF